MARAKTKRELKFKPRFKSFVPLDVKAESINLLHEEIEAIYLMDYKELYQEDAAKSMGVSRTTFSRIIKNARIKVATALINGKGLTIEDEKDEYVVAFICDNKEKFGSLSIHGKYLIFVTLSENKILSIKSVNNPMQDATLKPTNILPQMLTNENVNYFIIDKIGEGFKSSLQTKGIFVIKKDFLEKDAISKLQ
ncbi:MAG: DUF134 domain-containing protein [Sulfurimonas sp.]|nr:DUF134 domain-containing protein [Sulfurimonas sp.]